ncbi:MAG: GNAT family N-acetyltransferase [Ardenticatenales bacterium]|nr:GNAT family N-acetyltransferase [Ardenticatenales bacterium]
MTAVTGASGTPDGMHGTGVTIRPLVPDDVPALIPLRREALETAPLVFGSSPEDDGRGGSEAYMRASLADDDAAAVIGAFDGDRLVGMLGVIREQEAKARHRAYIWGMYVMPAYRRAGVGAALVAGAVERARGWDGVIQVGLSATEAAEGAERLYRRAGFREWGHEPRALCWEGEFVGERHFVLEFGAG